MDFCSKDFLEQRMNESNFLAHCGIRITGADDTGADGEILLGPQHTNHNAGVHGGVMYALADTVAGTAAIVWGVKAMNKTPEELSCTTVTSSFNFLRPLKEGTLHCRADCRKMGRTLAVVDVSLRDDEGREISAGTFTFLFVDRKRFMK